MAQKRNTKADRERQRTEDERAMWQDFRPKLESLQTYVDALRLVTETPPPDAPGRRFYSNLGFFLQSFTVPLGSNYTEKALYLQFIQRLDAAGSLKPGAGQRIEAELRRAMASQSPWE